ncbi:MULTISPECIES: DUF2793 domain-containing protein [Pacificibacter]|uniref:DUF2793 domain-containing protein n=1 Tax=Pacificibacter TaxID=1042323 RepID=UPI001C09C463|nr:MULTISPECIES: DUF2793 domain-containing protein [Pacificibacter]MBU2935629.1 DUF2793 domain-containing protein [Pacificibacter marinus]MDO6614125.1 DUF2793 domain-containing protein [Pacificibacter sp. 1_MG-2023]
MSDTTRFSLPLLQAAQAQKHVTVNEAITRLDGLMQLRLQSVTENTPPLTPQEGDAYSVANSAVNDWAGFEGNLALYVSGGWVFVPVTLGMRAYIVDQNGWAAFDGTTWQMGLQSLSSHGAGMQILVKEIDHPIAAGATSAVTLALPGQAVVYGVTGRVLSDITGTLTGFSVGVSGSSNRYGAGLSLSSGSWMRGLTGAPLTYYSDEDLILTAEGGDFAAGDIRLAIHYAQFSLPTA